MGKWFKSGSPWIWMTAGAVSLSLVAVLGLLLLIAWRGLTYFWPSSLYEWQLVHPDGRQELLIGEIYDREWVPMERLRDAGITLPGDEEFVERLLVKTGNREYVPLDFRWVLVPSIVSTKVPKELAVVERARNGNFYGYPVALQQGDREIRGPELDAALARAIDDARALTKEADRLQSSDIGRINHQLERLRLEQRKLALDGQDTPEALAEIDARREALNAEYQILERRLFDLREQAGKSALLVRDMRGQEVRLFLNDVLDVTYSNALSTPGKVWHWMKAVGSFVVDEPREANTEGGVFPAIFGTVFMVMLMAVIVTPFGVMAAVYLHEYAHKGPITRLIRIAVINLAGVPSIVYGVFGLGFFVYMVGGSLDELFYPEALPNPTFGTPGVLWSALTLAILTLPVVIVSTEEGLSRIPSAVRQGSLALGATKAETLWRIVLPMASPAIMTGLILAVARAAGEVAPLMLVGVVKLAPQLPVDGNFPYVHLDRKFMHLGFHIYDVGFQSPNVEAARPLVYATSFLLVTVIVALNLTAIGVRNHLREKFRAFDH
ncbi:phosphate ABC transporter, inner membrane subunit PstA [Ferrimonas balearica DSM 9799]|uniref:Phosphate transport system permease protein PstA n=1 Tax=Ferrimonas balearica (strain DSM 9799 / CCM 4581 / KCTC 23876 / PAT) TaxID=550540 RepID=E1SS61_FERBD|nr:phosphate ABC transporter permease PstA [Ferrimonas balearica]ADN76993.1 phosphate ABC transporter, inner membrane subunit PstA [Ferrimonas balearica DSM 9799]